MNSREHYTRREYDLKGRFASYWHQVDEVLGSRPGNVLQAGMGNGFLRDYLKRRDVEITDLDTDPDLGPDVVGDVRDMPFEDGQFDLCVCFEVLEHMPYEYFRAALSELKRVSRGRVIISVPDIRPVYRVFMELPVIGWFRLMIPRPRIRPGLHRPDDREHFWNINERGFPLRKVQEDIKREGLDIIRTYRVFEHPSHRFFVLEKK
jgi:predicted SAM-dependent methyltransferase